MDVQYQIKQNVREANEYIKDLNSWAKDVKQKKKKKKRSTVEQTSELKTGENYVLEEITEVESKQYTPPVRGRVNIEVKKLDQEKQQPARAISNPQTGKKKKKKKVGDASKTSDNAAGHTYDYFKDKWDKFDVDAALKEASASSSEEEEEFEETEAAIAEVVPLSSEGASHSNNVAAEVEEVKDRSLSHLEWKERGNEYFRGKQYQRAVECYSESILLEPSCVYYANRAMAFLKLDDFDSAISDCTEALKLDDSYLKAYQRRASAHKMLGNYLEATKDFEEGLRRSPNSKMMQEERLAMIEAFCSKEGLEKLSSRQNIPFEKPVVGKLHQGNPGSTSPDTEKDIKADYASGKKIPSQTSQKADEIAPSKEAVKPILSPQYKAQTLLLPTNSMEFETTWNSLKGNADVQWELLHMIEPANILNLLKNMMTGDMIHSIVKCIISKLEWSQANIQGFEHGVGILENMTKAPRFQMLVMCIPSKLKRELGALWQKKLEELPKELHERMALVGKSYRLL